MEANQETGAATDTPSESVVTEDVAIEHVAKMLEPEEPTSGDTDQANQPEPEAEDVKADTEEAELEVPDTVDDLATALGMEPEDLANHLRVRVKVAGEERLVTLSEAAKGQQLESDYRQKTSDLAEQRRIANEQIQQAQTEWQQKLQEVHSLYSMLEQQVGQEIPQEELDRLYGENPAEYIRVQAHMNQQRQALDKVRQSIQAEQQKAWNEGQQNQAKFREKQQKLLVEKLPEFGDSNKAQAAEQRLASGLKHYGFSDEEISGFVGGAFDHRMVMVADAAAKFFELSKGKMTEKVKAKPKMIKPGVGRDLKEPRAEQDAALRSRLKKATNKRAQDAAAVALVASRL